MAVSPDALILSVRKNRWTSPKDPAHPLPRLWFIGLLPKMRKAPGAAIHPSPQAHIAARDERRRSPAERTSALRSLFAPRACRCSFSQSKRYAAATTACLLPRAISPPRLTALRVRLVRKVTVSWSGKPHSRLRPAPSGGYEQCVEYDRILYALGYENVSC